MSHLFITDFFYRKNIVHQLMDYYLPNFPRFFYSPISLIFAAFIRYEPSYRIFLGIILKSSSCLLI